MLFPSIRAGIGIGPSQGRRRARRTESGHLGGTDCKKLYTHRGSGNLARVLRTALRIIRAPRPQAALLE